jgi:glyoxylase-like metal-dependent hydrolase (beta-lactamase superfamily II)
VQVSEGIHRLTQGVTNFYLIEESGKYTVVDAGTSGDWAYFASSVAGLGAKLADVDAVLLTHAHPDHTGSAGGSCARSHAGSAALLFEDRGVLVTGDVLATENALTGRIGPQIMPDGLNEDGAQALASLDALLGIDADLLLPGHGDPWTGA